MTTHKYRIYGLTDTIMFGHTDDLKKYWNYDEKDKYFFNNEEDVEVKLINKTPLVCEIYLCSRYLETIGVKNDWTLKHWWECLGKYFLVVDADSLDLFWPKYSYELHNRINKHYSRKASRSVEFSDWLALYSGEKVNWEKNNYQEEWSYKNKKLKREKIF